MNKQEQQKTICTHRNDSALIGLIFLSLYPAAGRLPHRTVRPVSEAYPDKMKLNTFPPKATSHHYR